MSKNNHPDINIDFNDFDDPNDLFYCKNEDESLILDVDDPEVIREYLNPSDEKIKERIYQLHCVFHPLWRGLRW